MLVADAYDYVIRNYSGEVGRFYAPGTSLGLGKGMLFGRSVFAVFDPERGVYRTAEGVAYLLTHECDVEEENKRPFNEDLLVCPLMRLEDVVEELSLDLDDQQLSSFMGSLGSRNIPRLVYLPPIPRAFDYGAVLFLNRITNAPADLIRQRAALICAVTAYGLSEIEYALENHLLRPKSDRLTLDLKTTD